LVQKGQLVVGRFCLLVGWTTARFSWVISRAEFGKVRLDQVDVMFRSVMVELG